MCRVRCSECQSGECLFTPHPPRDFLLSSYKQSFLGKQKRNFLLVYTMRVYNWLYLVIFFTPALSQGLGDFVFKSQLTTYSNTLLENTVYVIDPQHPASTGQVTGASQGTETSLTDTAVTAVFSTSTPRTTAHPSLPPHTVSTSTSSPLLLSIPSSNSPTARPVPASKPVDGTQCDTTAGVLTEVFTTLSTETVKRQVTLTEIVFHTSFFYPNVSKSFATATVVYSHDNRTTTTAIPAAADAAAPSSPTTATSLLSTPCTTSSIAATLSSSTLCGCNAKEVQTVWATKTVVGQPGVPANAELVETHETTIDGTAFLYVDTQPYTPAWPFWFNSFPETSLSAITTTYPPERPVVPTQVTAGPSPSATVTASKTRSTTLYNSIIGVTTVAPGPTGSYILLPLPQATSVYPQPSSSAVQIPTEIIIGTNSALLTPVLSSSTTSAAGTAGTATIVATTTTNTASASPLTTGTALVKLTSKASSSSSSSSSSVKYGTENHSTGVYGTGTEVSTFTTSSIPASTTAISTASESTPLSSIPSLTEAPLSGTSTSLLVSISASTISGFTQGSSIQSKNGATITTSSALQSSSLAYHQSTIVIHPSVASSEYSGSASTKVTPTTARTTPTALLSNTPSAAQTGFNSASAASSIFSSPNRFSTRTTSEYSVIASSSTLSPTASSSSISSASASSASSSSSEQTAKEPFDYSCGPLNPNNDDVLVCKKNQQVKNAPASLKLQIFIYSVIFVVLVI